MSRDALDSQDGISVDAANGGMQGLIFPTFTKIKDVTSKNNLRDGMQLRGFGIAVKDSTTSHNGRVGISVAGEILLFMVLPLTVVMFEGVISSHHNKEDGLEVGPGLPFPAFFKFAAVYINGELNTYLNGLRGFYVRPSMAMVLYFGKRGSLNACQNYGDDLAIEGDVFFFMDISDYLTCDKGEPECMPCPLCN
jgi:hypothetical protein